MRNLGLQREILVRKRSKRVNEQYKKIELVLVPLRGSGKRRREPKFATDLKESSEFWLQTYNNLELVVNNNEMYVNYL